MSSRKKHTRKPRVLNSGEVYKRAEQWLADVLEVDGLNWKWTATVIWAVVLMAAGRTMSLLAVCVQRLGKKSAHEGLCKALRRSLPKYARVVERKLNEALCRCLPAAVRRVSRRLAIDWHLVPYHGEPQRHKKELYRSKSQSGTTKFHAYATACIVEKGYRYTLAYTWVQKGETQVQVLTRLLDRVRSLQIGVRVLLVDRAFFSVAVLRYLQNTGVPFVMPVVLRGRQPKDPRRTTGLRAFLKKALGWYSYTMKSVVSETTFRVCVAQRTYAHHRTKKKCKQKLLYAVWRYRATPREIRDLYRTRFGIETSYRQLKQARIRTSSRDPLLRVFLVGVALVLRNVWVWLLWCYFREEVRGQLVVHFDKLRFRQMLDWIVREVSMSILNNDACYQTDTITR